MRKLLLLLLIASGCSKDDDPKVEATIAGEWELVKQEQTFFDDDGNEYDPNGDYKFFTSLRFKDNSRGDFYQGDTWYPNSLIVNGSSISVDNPLAESEQSLTVTKITDKELVLDFNGNAAYKQGEWTFFFDCKLVSTYKRK